MNSNDKNLEARRILIKLSDLFIAVEKFRLNPKEKLILMKSLLELRLYIVSFLAKCLKAAGSRGVGRPKGNGRKKEEQILQFIREKGRSVTLGELAVLNIASRSLRRYLKNLRTAKKISVEKRGRDHFYSAT